MGASANPQYGCMMRIKVIELSAYRECNCKYSCPFPVNHRAQEYEN